MPKQSSSRQTYTIGFILCVVGALMVILLKALGAEGALNSLINNANADPLIWLILYVVLGIVTLVVAVRTRTQREPLLALLVLIFGIIFIILDHTLTSLIFWAGILILIGAILILADRT
ncbi:MAG: hypothetical protein ACFFCO_05465 [Promethearchaeota archaeon]